MVITVERLSTAIRETKTKDTIPVNDIVIMLFVSAVDVDCHVFSLLLYCPRVPYYGTDV